MLLSSRWYSGTLPGITLAYGPSQRGELSMPDSHPWYSVIRPWPCWSRPSASQRCQRTRSGQRRSRNASATARVERPRVRARSRMRCTAMACTGGWVIPEVCRCRGAWAASAEHAHRAGPGSSRPPRWRTRCAGSSRWPTAPTARCRVRPRPAPRSAVPGRPRRTRRPSSTCADRAAAPPRSSRPGRCREAGRPRGRRAAWGEARVEGHIHSALRRRRTQVGRVTACRPAGRTDAPR